MSKKLTTDQYIQKCKLAHGERYDYFQLYYEGNKIKVEIICRKHGLFKQRPADHRRGFGCPTCSNKASGTTESFINKAINIHGDFYDYSKVVYRTLDHKVIIICPKHGEYQLIARRHIYGSAIGCNKCNRSKGELRVQEWLIQNKIRFEEQKTFKGMGTSRFDFYLPDINTCIEYDGAQHFHVRHQKTRDKELAQRRFQDIKRRDLKKDVFCKQENMRLIRIHFKQLNNINQILNNAILHNSTISSSQPS